MFGPMALGRKTKGVMCSGAEEATTKGKKIGNRSFAASSMPSYHVQATNSHGSTAMDNLNESTACSRHTSYPRPQSGEPIYTQLSETETILGIVIMDGAEICVMRPCITKSLPVRNKP